ncbi:DUF4232 domain-containing protein [Streptomyces sp. NPDC052114]|uniref:DUF4232 domain-containing protein n=1 Tax=unclassified Streptomyces TaxID=2593676 RepID=UPI003427A005
MRTGHVRRAVRGAVGLALAAVLTTTGCSGSGGDATAKGEPRPSPSPTGSPGGSPAPSPSGTPAPAPTGDFAPCTTAGTRASVGEDPEGDLMLTVTNTGKEPCVALGAPRLRFGSSRTVTTPVTATRPDAPVTLAPGRSAYAGILTAWEPDDFVTVRRVSLSFAADARGRAAAGPWVTVALPRATEYEESDAEVTYWQGTREDAHADG